MALKNCHTLFFLNDKNSAPKLNLSSNLICKKYFALQKLKAGMRQWKEKTEGRHTQFTYFSITCVHNILFPWRPRVPGTYSNVNTVSVE